MPTLLGIEYCELTEKVTQLRRAIRIMDDIGAKIREEVDQISLVTTRDEYNLFRDRVFRLVFLIFKAGKIFVIILKQIIRIIPRGQNLVGVEYISESTLRDVHYINFHLERFNHTFIPEFNRCGWSNLRNFPEIVVVVYEDDWPEDLEKIQNRAQTMEVDLVFTTKGHPPGPTGNYVHVRDLVRDLKNQTATYIHISNEVRVSERKVAKNTVKCDEMKNNGADPYVLLQQKVELEKWKILVSRQSVSLEAALYNIKQTLAELLEFGYRGKEIKEACRTIREAN